MMFSRSAVILSFLLAVAALTVGVWRYGYMQALDQLSGQAAADLALASDRLSTQLQVYQELAVLTADHPGLDQLQTAADRDAAAALLLNVADKTGAMDVVFADRYGVVQVSARGLVDGSLAKRPYFQRALQGALGTGHAVLGATGRRAYFHAAPTFALGGRVRGALVMVADIEDVEQAWRGSTPAVFFTDAKDEVFISNRSELLFWRRTSGKAGIAPTNREVPFSARQTGRHEIWALDWGPYLPRRALHLTKVLPIIGMKGEVLVDVAPARRLAALQAAAVAAICLAFGALLFLATERRRTLAQANAVLETRVRERTRALTDANVQLQREVVERQEAEAALKRAQAELVQAGKLSALGQMSAGISHELNQPLMAIQQFADNGAAFLGKGKTDRAGENLSRISALAARAARIIKNLRAFARNESEPMGKVDLVQVVETAIDLTAARLRRDDVALDWCAPTAPIHAWGGEVRLSQVFVNLINNAADAMLDQPDRRIRIHIETETRLAVIVQDSGPGLAEPERIFDPFYSTKAVGSAEGMGLGLSISYGLVQSFGGDIRGANTDRGAVFTVELERFKEENAA